MGTWENETMGQWDNGTRFCLIMVTGNIIVDLTFSFALDILRYSENHQQNNLHN